MKGSENLSIRGIDREVWKQFRALCLIEGIPVGKKLNALLRQAIKEGE